MSFPSIVVYFAVLLCISVSSNKLPDFIKLCSRNDPKIKECALKHARDAIPHLLNGYKALNVPKLNPLKITSLEVETGPNLKLSFQNITVYGFDTITVDDAQLDVENRKVGLTLHAKEIKLDAIYDIKGQILILPIVGNGPAHIKMVDAVFNYTFGWDYVMKNGILYGSIKDEGLTFSTGRSFYKLENLFNGDETLGAQMNKFLDEMWMDVNTEIGPSITETIKIIVHKILYGIADTIPFDNIITV